MIKRIFGTFGLGILVFLSLHSCKGKGKQVDISDVKIQTSFYRFDELLTQNDAISEKQWQDTEKNHGDFLSIFSDAVLGNEEPSLANLQQFKAYFDSTGVNQMVKKEFANFPEQEGFTKMQKRMKALFPNYQAVGLTPMVSGFNYKNMMLDEQLAVGLELYLGDKIDYTQIGNVVNDYQIHRFSRDYILPDAATAIVDDYYQDKGEFNTLLKRIIFEGKKLYVKEQLLPNTSGDLLIGLTPETYDWCKKNEQQVWQYFINEELLYNNDIHRWKTYVFDGPFSAGMPEGAPAMTGNFIGWQIIKSYMNENKGVSIAELLQNEDAVSIFKQAKYTP